MPVLKGADKESNFSRIGSRKVKLNSFYRQCGHEYTGTNFAIISDIYILAIRLELSCVHGSIWQSVISLANVTVVEEEIISTHVCDIGTKSIQLSSANETPSHELSVRLLQLNECISSEHVLYS